MLRCLVFLLLLSTLTLASENDSVPPSAQENGKEKGFYQELVQLSERQEKELQRYRKETRDLEPEERLRRRRVLMNTHRREFMALEAKWGDKANDQHHRWQQRQEERRKRLEALRRKSSEKPRETRSVAVPDTVKKDAEILPAP